jgi:hypothetical protein
MRHTKSSTTIKIRCFNLADIGTLGYRSGCPLFILDRPASSRRSLGAPGYSCHRCRISPCSITHIQDGRACDGISSCDIGFISLVVTVRQPEVHHPTPPDIIPYCSVISHPQHAIPIPVLCSRSHRFPPPTFSLPSPPTTLFQSQSLPLRSVQPVFRYVLCRTCHRIATSHCVNIVHDI